MNIKEKIKQSKFGFISLVSTGIFFIFLIIGMLTNNTAFVTTQGFHPPLLYLFPILALIFRAISKKKDEINIIKRLTFYNLFLPILLTISYFLLSINNMATKIALLIAIFVLIIDIISSFSTRKDSVDLFLGKSVVDEDVFDPDIEPGDFVLGKVYKRNMDEEGHTPDGEDEYVLTEAKAVLPLHDRFVHVLVLGVTGSGKTSQSLLPMFVQDFESDNFEYENISVVQMGQIILEPKGDFAKTAWAIGKIKEKAKRKNYMKFLTQSEERLNKKLNSLNEQRKLVLEKEHGIPLKEKEEQEFNLASKKLKNLNALNDQEKVEYSTVYNELLEKKNGKKLEQVEKDGLKLIEDSMKKLLFVKKELPKYLKLNDFTDLNDKSTFALFKYSSLLTDIIANPESYEASWNDIKAQDPHEDRDLIMLFDPSAKNSSYFNPLFGREDVAVGTVTTTLMAFMADSSSYFQNMSKVLTQNSIRVVKKVYGDDATLNHVNDLFTNNGGRGEEIIKKLQGLSVSSKEALANRDLASYFMTDYYTGLKGARTATKTYEQTSGVRSILNNLLDDARLKRVLNPPEGIGTNIDFDKILRTGDKVALSTATGVSDELGKMLGSFLILQLQAAIFRRPGSENTRTPVILYIDEFQDYASSSFEDVLTKGRSYVVSATMATQTLGIVAAKAGDGLVNNLQSNARNVIVYPGASVQDAKYFVSLFGTVKSKEVKRSVSQEVVEEKSGLDKAKAVLGLDGEDGHASGPRESVSEQLNNDERFNETQVLYGPNVYNRGQQKNDSFGAVFYRIIRKNSVQTPAVAKIEYIPYELKKATDAKVATYDAVNSHLNDETDADENGELVDPLDKEKSFNENSFVEEVMSENKDINESSPADIVRDENGEIDKSTETESEGEIDIPEVSIDDVDVPELPDIPDIPDDIDSDIPIDDPFK